MTRLTKAAAEDLVGAIDAPTLRDVVAGALRTVLGVDEFASDWAALVQLAAERAEWPASRARRLVREDDAALAELALELSELRQLSTLR